MDRVIEYVRSDSPLADKANVEYSVIKETERPKFTPKQVVDTIKAEGFIRFGMHQHTMLWKAEDAKNPGKGYGVNVAGKYWHWYESWIEFVIEHCRKNSKNYK